MMLPASTPLLPQQKPNDTANTLFIIHKYLQLPLTDKVDSHGDTFHKVHKFEMNLHLGESNWWSVDSVSVTKMQKRYWNILGLYFEEKVLVYLINSQTIIRGFQMYWKNRNYNGILAHFPKQISFKVL